MAFDCGCEKLNEYLKKYALQNELMGYSRTFLLLDGFEIIGFYTLATGCLSWDSLSDNQRRKMPKYDLPFVRIARLAVDIKYQRKGYGSLMLIDICKRAVAISKLAGVYALFVEAKEEAIGFYQKYGFVSLKSDVHKMYLPLSSLEGLNQN